jgi:ribonuclease T2
VKAALFVLAAVATPLHAQAYQCRVPDRVTVPTIAADGPPRRSAIVGYTLALSWSPEFCKGRERSARDRAQCSGGNGSFGLVVHGLWPEGPGSWPQWCKTSRALSPAEARRNMCMIPSPRVQASEWAKHGACMVRTPESYFKVVRILWNGLRKPDLDRLSRDKALTAGAIREAFVIANPDWPRSAIGLALNERGWLEDVRLCYAKSFMPAPCERGRFGPPDAAPAKVWRGL